METTPIGFPTVLEINLLRSMISIGYQEGYKYRLAADYVTRTPIRPPADIITDYVVLTMAGVLYVRKGYAWDGASGPTFDTPSSMRPSLAHDALCQLMRERMLSYRRWAKTVHRLFYEQCIEDGMFPLRANLWHAGVLIGQGGNPEHEDPNPIVYAPPLERRIT